MSRPYARGTKISEARSHFDLQQLLKKYGATDSGWLDRGEGDEQVSYFMFVRNGSSYKFTIRLPAEENRIQVDSRYRPGTHGTRIDYERSRKMRALVAVVKAQLVAIEEGIMSFEEMFVGSVVTDNGQTVAERWAPEIAQQALGGRYPSALPMPGESRK